MAGLNGGSWWNPIDNIFNRGSGLTVDPNAPLDGSSRSSSGSPLLGDDRGTDRNFGTINTEGQALGAYTEGNAGSGASAADLAYYDDQESLLRSLLNTTQTRLGQGLTALGDDYGRESGRLNEDRARTARDFGIKTEDTTRAKDSAIGRVDTNARTLANSLRQRIGLASGSGSSAYQVTAPGAVARDASINRQGVQEDFGANFRNLDIAKKDSDTQYGRTLEDLARQKAEKESGLREGILGQEQSIYGQLADIARNRAAAAGGGIAQARAASAPYQGQYAERQSQIDGLFNQFRTPYNVKPVEVQQPTLNDYTVDRAAIGGGRAQTDTYSPYSNLLRKMTEEDEQKLY